HFAEIGILIDDDVGLQAIETDVSAADAQHRFHPCVETQTRLPLIGQLHRLVHGSLTSFARASDWLAGFRATLRNFPFRPSFTHIASCSSTTAPQCSQVTSPLPFQSGCLSVFLLSLRNRIPELG